MSCEIGVRHELARGMPRSRRHQADPFAVILLYEAHRFGDVAVVAHDDRAIVGVQPAIVEQVDRQIDVRALLLGPDHLDGALVGEWSGKRRAHLVAHEMPEIHLDL